MAFFNPSAAFSSLAQMSKLAPKNPSTFSRFARPAMMGFNSYMDNEEMNPYLRIGGNSPASDGGSLPEFPDGSEMDLFAERLPSGETLRFHRSLLGGNPSQVGSDTTGRPSTPRPMRGDDRYLQDMLDIQNNVGPATKAYREHVGNVPLRENFAPSKWRRLAAALGAGAIAYEDPRAGIVAAEEFKNRPYNQAVESYKLKGDVLGEQADIEQAESNAKLRALQQARALGLKYDEFELKRRETEAKMRNDQTTAEAAMMRARAYAEAQGKPNWVPQLQQDGSVIMINPKNPKEFMKVPGQSVAAGQLGVARTNAATAAGNLRESVRRTNINRDLRQGDQRIRMHDIDTRGSRSNEDTPREQLDAEYMASRQMMSDPLFADYISFDDDGNLVMAQDDGTEDYQDFLEAFDAKVAEILSGSTRRSTRRR